LGILKITSAGRIVPGYGSPRVCGVIRSCGYIVRRSSICTHVTRSCRGICRAIDCWEFAFGVKASERAHSREAGLLPRDLTGCRSAVCVRAGGEGAIPRADALAGEIHRCRVGSYCLMCNHFHLLLEVPPMAEGGIPDEVLLKRLSAICGEDDFRLHRPEPGAGGDGEGSGGLPLEQLRRERLAVDR
jgi:hypothetical protein